jgi:phosphatase NudJ
MPRSPVDSYSFVLVVVEHEGKVLLVRERKHGQTWYLPAGGVEIGETLVTAAVRETMEEAGVHVAPTHLLALDQTWTAMGGVPSVHFRFVFRARVIGDPTPKSLPDRHSLGAMWVAREHFVSLPLRAPEVVGFAALARSAAPKLPLELVEQAGFVMDDWRWAD